MAVVTLRGFLRGFVVFVVYELSDLFGLLTGRNRKFQRWLDEHPDVVVYKVEDIAADTPPPLAGRTNPDL